MKFTHCKIKSIRADIANGELTVSFGLVAVRRSAGRGSRSVQVRG